MSPVIAHCVDESGTKFSRETIWLGIPQGKHISNTKSAHHFGGIAHLIGGFLGGC